VDALEGTLSAAPLAGRASSGVLPSKFPRFVVDSSRSRAIYSWSIVSAVRKSPSLARRIHPAGNGTQSFFRGGKRGEKAKSGHFQPKPANFVSATTGFCPGGIVRSRLLPDSVRVASAAAGFCRFPSGLRQPQPASDGFWPGGVVRRQKSASAGGFWRLVVRINSSGTQTQSHRVAA